MVSGLGLYQPGNSVFHRLPAGAKLAGLLVLAVATVGISKIWWLPLIGCLFVLACYRFGGFSVGEAIKQVRPMAFILAFMMVANTIAFGWQQALGIVAMIVMLMASAALVTLTTRTSDLMAVVVKICRPLRRFGVDPDRVGLALTLGIRCVPLVAGLARGVREAQLARGNQKSWRAFAVPLLISAIRDAQRLGDALVARGVDDD